MTRFRERRSEGGEAEHAAHARPVGKRRAPDVAPSPTRPVADRRAPDVAPSPTLPISPSPTRPEGREGPYVAQSEVRVRYVETDQMGVAHHSNYFAWFEVGRTDFIRALGTSYARLERDGLLLAIAEASVRYLSAARYDDVLVVRTRLERVQSRSVTFEYEVLRAEPLPQARIATAAMKLIALTRDGSPRTFPPDFRRLLEQVATPATGGA